MQATSIRFLPLLVSGSDEQLGEEHVLDEFADDLWIAYSYGPPYGADLVTWADLERGGLGRRTLRRTAMENLDASLSRLRVTGQPPALLLSFGGLESSVLLVDDFWDALSDSVPGELVVGVPARDVVIITGSQSRPGREKVRRTVDRVFLAGDPHLLSRDLLVWRQGMWLPFHPAAPGRGADRPVSSQPARPVSGLPGRPVSGSPARPVSGQLALPSRPASGPPDLPGRPISGPRDLPGRPDRMDWAASEPVPGRPVSARPYRSVSGPPEPAWAEPEPSYEPDPAGEPPYEPEPPEEPYRPSRARREDEPRPKVRWSESPQPEELARLKGAARRMRRPNGPTR